MQFFQSFSSLGYSAINLLLVWLVVVAVSFRILKIQSRHWILKALFSFFALALLVIATNFLADQNQMLNDAIRNEGGLKRTLPKN